MARPIILRWGGLFGTHPRATKTREPGSGSNDLAVVAIAYFCTGAISNAVRHDWFWALACATSAALVFAFCRAWTRRQTAQRWREAIKRRDELKAARAEAVRLHRPVSHIDAELKPLTNRMMSGAI